MPTLIATLGSNALPVAVAVERLEPTCLQLVYTPEVRRVAERLIRLLEKRRPGLEVRHVCITAHRRPSDIVATLGNDNVRSALADAAQNGVLHYAGGTKALAVHMHRLWQGAPSRTCYLSSDGFLYWDDAAVEPLSCVSEPKFSLRELCELHFGKTPQVGDSHLRAHLSGFADRIGAFFRSGTIDAYQRLLPPMEGDATIQVPPGQDLEVHYRAHLSGPNMRDGGPLSAATDVAALCELLGIGTGTAFQDVVNALGFQGAARQQRGKAYKWVEGEWLEVWLASLLRLLERHGQPLFDEVHDDVTVGGDDFQMDVVAVRGHRAFLFSCTVEQRTSLVKQKLFEAAHRASRIGGEHARAAVVSMHPQPLEVLSTARDEHWEGYDTLRSFGKLHLGGQALPCTFGTLQQMDQPGPNETLLDGIERWVIG